MNEKIAYMIKKHNEQCDPSQSIYTTYPSNGRVMSHVFHTNTLNLENL